MATSSPIQERPSLYPVQTGIRRSFTLPPRSLSYHERAGLDPSDSAANILFSHPSARIVKFSPPTSAALSVSGSSSQDYEYPVDTIETLPWASTTETTVASGLLIIEKVQGSTSFLKSGAVTHAILRNSQCWCVDGVSKFVLRIKKLEYYRIELPTNSDNDRAKVEELKELLKKILRFERTPCPFKRGFHVDLSESDITPRRKGTWKRRQSSQISTPVNGTPLPLSRGRSSRTEPLQVDTRSDRDEQEEESATNGSDFDEDEVHSESDGQGDRTSQSPATYLLEPPVDKEAETQEDRTGRAQLGGDEPARNETDDGQATTDPSVTVTERSRMESEDLPLTETGPSRKVTDPVPEEVETSEPEGDEIERDPPRVEASIKPRAGEEAALQPMGDRLDPTTGERSPSEAIALEPALAETVDEQSRNSKPDEMEADDIDDSIEMRRDSRPIDTISIASSTNSFHSLDAPDSPTSPTSLSCPDSPPSPTPRAELLDPLATYSHHAHKREISELTITPSPGLDSPERPSTSASDRPTTPQLARSSASDGSWTEVETPSGPLPTNQIRHRLKTRRSLSPLPPSPTLFTPSPQQDRSNHLTSALLRKACSLALGKPIEVVVMLIHVLARIAGGATVNDLMSGDLFKTPGEEQDQQRNRNLPDHIDGKGDDDLDEDDFGVPLRGRGRGSVVVKAEVDTDSLSDLD